MPFTDTGANRTYTHVNGPILVGDSTGLGSGSGVANGSAALPLYAYYNSPETGMYLASASTSAAEMRMTANSTTMATYSTAGVKVGTSGLESTAPTGPQMFVAQATGAMSSGSAPVAMYSGAALVFAAESTSIGRLWVYSTILGGWAATTSPMRLTGT